MNKVLLLLSLLLSSSPAFSQDDPTYIEVYGSAESEITPDIILVSVRLKEYDENKTKVPMEVIESEFLKAAEKSDIPNENIQLGSFELNSFQRKRRDRDFRAEKTYQVQFSSSAEIMTFLDNLQTVKLDYLGVTKLTHSEIEKYRLELKIEALKAAGRKADALLEAVGAKRGKPLIIDEGGKPSFWTPQNTSSNFAYGFLDAEAVNANEVPIKKIKLRFEIRARFEIE